MNTQVPPVEIAENDINQENGVNIVYIITYVYMVLYLCTYGSLYICTVHTLLCFNP